MKIAEVSIVPIGTGETSVSKYVRKAVETLKKEGVQVTPGAMGTIIEAETLEQIFNAVKKAHQAIADMGAERIITEIKIDDRRDKEITAEDKIKKIS